MGFVPIVRFACPSFLAASEQDRTDIWNWNSARPWQALAALREYHLTGISELNCSMCICVGSFNSLNLDLWNVPEHQTRSALSITRRNGKQWLQEIASEDTTRALWEIKGHWDDNKYRGIVESEGKGQWLALEEVVGSTMECAFTGQRNKV